jgi:hypothetical protein
MKFDKELVLKHRFWVGLAVAVPLALIGIMLLLTSVSAQIAGEQKRILKDFLELKKSPDKVYNDAGIAEAAKQAEYAKSRQFDVWKAAYKAQEFLFKWPDKVEEQFEFFDGLVANEVQIAKDAKDVKDWPEDRGDVMQGLLKKVGKDYFTLADRKGQKVTFHNSARLKIAEEGGAAVSLNDKKYLGKPIAVKYQRGKYFTDPLTQSEMLVFIETYKDQIHPLLQQVDPLRLDEKGHLTGVVQLKGLPLYDPKSELRALADVPFLNFISDDWKKGNDISEEAWYAQEEIWVQREIYRLIRAANDLVSKFEKDQTADKDGSVTFKNVYFKLKLKLAPGGDELQVTITNRLKRRQKLDQSFLIRFQKDGDAPEKILIPGEPLEPAGNAEKADTKFLKIPLDKNPRRKGIFNVEQVLTWETAAVRRIDDLDIAEEGAESHRTYQTKLRSYTEKKEDANADPNAPPGGPPGGQPGGRGVPRGNRGGARGIGGGKGPRAPQGGLPNGMARDRYLEVTPQARRIPVAVVLIVDQDHVDRVLTAFDNSPLRFLITQVTLNHFPGSLRPPEPTAGGVAGNPGPGIPGQEAAQDLEANMELVIYGIVTLYERYPPRPQQTPVEVK